MLCHWNSSQKPGLRVMERDDEEKNKRMFLILMKLDGKGYHKPREHPLKFGVDPSRGADA